MLSRSALEASVLELRAVEEDPSRLIYASVSHASRTFGLASGVLGLQLALLENIEGVTMTDLIRTCKSLKPFNDQSIDFVESGLAKAIVDPIRFSQLIEGRIQEMNSLPDTSDAFVGVVSAAWAMVIAGHENFYPNNLNLVNLPVENRFGFAHGLEGLEIVNSLAKTNFRANTKRFEPKNPGGWCNGVIAYAALLASQDVNVDSEITQLCMAQLDQIHSLPSDGLCHGKAGVLVATMGIARTTNNVSLAQRCQEIFANLFLKLPSFNSEVDTYSDFSWLTGLAGIVWAHAVMLRPPLVNPIVPNDRLR